MAQQQPRQGAAPPQQPNWACAASRLCGFRNNFPNRETCWKCGRDRLGRMVRESPASSEQGGRSASAGRRRRSGPPPRGRGGPPDGAAHGEPAGPAV
eukprot:3892492-Pyramimonas_sp.AAC.1